MRGKRKAAKAGAGAVAAGQAVRSNEYVQRLMDDDSLREDLRDAYHSARKAYGRLASSKGPAKALFDDRKTQRDLRDAAESLRDAATTLRGVRRKRRGRRGVLVVALVGGAAAAVMLNEGVRQKVLDTLFGAEEEFEYTSSTVPPAPTETASATAGAS